MLRFIVALAVLVALVKANDSRSPKKPLDHIQDNIIDHGPKQGVYKPKELVAYNHFGHKGEQKWKNLSKFDKKKYLKKLRKYKKFELEQPKAGYDTDKDLRLQHIDSWQDRHVPTKTKVNKNADKIQAKKWKKQKQRKMKKTGTDKKAKRDKDNKKIKKEKLKKQKYYSSKKLSPKPAYQKKLKLNK